MSRKYIIFRADWSEEHGAETRLLHTGALTDIIAEHFDSSNSPPPEVGYRLREYHHIQQFTDSTFPHASTHSRMGDWVVCRTSQYTPSGECEDFEAVVICYCRYSPVTTALLPLPEVQVPELQAQS